ncbi:hypothetical protein RclHR1_01210016 [Rhizophagus clarus]|uniref:Hemocyanin middle domain-containing protein n=1 Tax=Rhizophagus clarus TaxID=94130 RepID=A0A2Z6QY63_9GLOM|nr:hypothetical protein RclHR1_01210016 [Rhizophagus clarus]
MADGWPDKSIYDPAKDKMYWWRNDPVLNQFHEHWHYVVSSRAYNGTLKYREGEIFIYTHRHIYDVNRWCIGMPLVEPLTDYLRPIHPTPSIFVTVHRWTTSQSSLSRYWHPRKLNLTVNEATILGDNIEVVLHGIGHNMLAYICDDMPPVTIREKDLILSFTEVLLEVDKDGVNDTWVKYANEKFGEITSGWKMVKIMKESNIYIQGIGYGYMCSERFAKSCDINVRVWIAPIDMIDNHAYWIEIDKFKRTLGPYEKTVVSQRCDHAVVIRKPAQKTPKHMDDTAMTPWQKEKLNQLNLAQIAEKVFCNCGWPYNLIIPRGNEKWTDKVPDIKLLGSPFDRPFKDGSFHKTFQGMKNVAHTDITIKWVEDFPEE